MVGSAHLRLEGVGKRFGGVWAVSGVDLSVEPGEVVALLGPSGCGKTTLLRCISGLETPTLGRIEVGGRTAFCADQHVNEPPERRQIGLVFQSYALWPHFTVAQNVGYGLKVKGVAKAQIDKRVADMLHTVGLDGMGERYPSTLSGGQQQRVALARSLVVEARVLLFDEPLSNLDLKLREEMRHELRQLVNRLGFTAVFVTHDQGEAMVLADRIALMSAGRLVQLGTAREIYDRPQTRFALEFLGSANLLSGTFEADGARAALRTAAGAFELAEPARPDCLVAIRPEHILILPPGRDGPNLAQGTILEAIFLGSYCLYHVDCNGLRLQVQSSDPNHRQGDRVTLHLPKEALRQVAEKNQ